MFADLRRRVKKAGQAPGTPVYTGNKKTPTQITFINYSTEDFQKQQGTDFKTFISSSKPDNLTWVHVEGLTNVAVIEEIAKHYQIHPLTLEDVLNVDQRPKVEEFENYIFVTIKSLFWHKQQSFVSRQISLILGDRFILSFEETPSTLFENIQERLKTSTQQRLRQHGVDYLLYRLLDSVVDQYFLVLEKLGEQIEKIEDRIVASPTPQRAKVLYQLKRRMLMLRKIIWPVREIIGHLFHSEEKFISPFTHTYLRDVYDHTVQAIDTTETFRDILSNVLDIYLSSLTNRMNEVMKILTIISTIFIPMTFIASIYGMNFINMPELHTKYGYYAVILLMVCVALVMIHYFRRKNWF